MRLKKVRAAAYGLAVIMAASAMSVNVQAAKLSNLLPSAGIGVTFSKGVTLAQIQERMLAEAAQDKNMKLSLSEMKKSLAVRKMAPKTIISASAVKAVEVQQALVQIEIEKEQEASRQIEQEATAVVQREEQPSTPEAAQPEMKASETEGTVIATVANAAVNQPVASENVSTEAQAQTAQSAALAGNSESAESTQPVADTSAVHTQSAAVQTPNTVSGVETKAAKETKETKETNASVSTNDAKTTVIETTQSVVELAAAQAAMMTDEEKEFSTLVIAKVNNYVNVRSDAGETNEIVGKLYDKSVGTYISEKNGWYQIKSGNVTGYVKAEFCVTGKDAVELAKQVGTRIATVTTTTLKVREEASTEAAVLGLVPMAEELSVVEEKDGWIKVDIEEGHGWVSMDYVKLRTDFVKAESREEEAARLAKEAEERRKARAAASANTKKSTSGSNKNYNAASSYIPAGGGSTMGNAVAQFALQFVGNPYVWGGTSLTNGADCSGFVMSVYQNFGVSLPHSSSADRRVGSAVGSMAEAQPGDLICYSGHVALYIGGGQIVHASTARTGIIVSEAGYRNILAIRRIF